MALTPDEVAAGLHILGFMGTLLFGLRLYVAGQTLCSGQRLSIAIFTIFWLTLFASSSAFHLAPAGRWRDALAVADDAAIVLAIAAAWTPLGPFRLLALDAHRMLAITWVSTLLLLALTAWAARNEAVRRALSWAYLAQAVAPGVLYGRTIMKGFSRPLLGLLLASMLLYGGGMALYLRPDLVWAHAAWHAAVLAGCFCNHCGLACLIADAKRADAA